MPRDVRSLRSTGFQCPTDANAQTFFTTGTYRGAPGIEDRDNWASLFQDYMGVPATSEWETETWNYLLVYPDNRSHSPSHPDNRGHSPSHMVMYHWHQYTDFTPAFAGADEHLFFATPLSGNSAPTKNPYTEWANMHATVGMAPIWTNRWRAAATSKGGGGPLFGCPSMETSFQLVSYKGSDLRSHNYHWVLWREVMQDGIIYASVRWIQVTAACKDDYTTCPPFDPIGKGLFGTADDPQYATRLFTKTFDSPFVRDDMRLPSIGFQDSNFEEEIRGYTDTRIFVHEYFNRTSLKREFKGFGYTGHNHTTLARLT